ncbi:ABC transporter substrate-binding protein [Mesorhizobium sp. VK23B]|uniref:ABC transporter substrate-binding protein n=1 Tax=Mesorhizobium dulcispinae TaxID=3072316 RepID=A0ABU4XMV5_9HYPH|nr:MULTISPECIES: ABC transporter substrate-binding protein [unclassified Mesorhizobium]MDX8469730.1 ABC transporter substrate-binding protein [Mesorhizobium sp. VK23B]MDX8476069.1 ABC transporter substrate-binding protein [Mesorhizobium sp. VK23A]
MNRRQLLAAMTSATLIASAREGWSQANTPFKIGALNPITGSGAAYGTGMQKTIFAAVDEINGAGGAAGRKLQVVADDDQSQPQAGVLAAKKLIEIDDVQALVGIWSSGVALATIPLANDANIPVMVTSGAPEITSPKINSKGLVYRFNATGEGFGQAFAEVCAREGFKRPATMAFNNASGVGTVEGFRKAWAKKGGEIVEAVVYEPNQPSYRSELQKILSVKPDVIVAGSYLADTTIILREWFQTGETQKWILPGWAANADLVRAVGADVTEGLLVVNSVSNETSSAFMSYDAAYRKAMNQSGADNVYAAMAWDMVVVLALAIEAAGPNAEIAAINAKIKEVTNPPGAMVSSFAEGKNALKVGKINYEGASSSVDFSATSDLIPDFDLSVIADGKINRRYIVKI